MSKKSNNQPPKRDAAKTADYYKLHTKAVKDLVEANEENSPPVSEKELRKYRSGFKFHIPDIVKIMFIKWWFPACVCYFFFWGLGMYVHDTLDMLFITGIALGMVTDILTNNALRFLEPYAGAWSKWILFYKKRYATFPLNILYSLGLLFLVFTTYTAINVMLLKTASSDTAAFLGVEPIIFGLFYMGFDMLVNLMRNTFRNIMADAKKPGR